MLVSTDLHRQFAAAHSEIVVSMIGDTDQIQTQAMNMTAPNQTKARVLLADIGGTNARFAVLDDGIVGQMNYLLVRDHATFRGALDQYLKGVTEPDKIDAAVIAVAGPVQNGRCVLTNSSWVIDERELCDACGFSTARLINDFEAVAWSLPHLAADKLLQIGGQQPLAGMPLVAIGPGTGLGVG